MVADYSLVTAYSVGSSAPFSHLGQGDFRKMTTPFRADKTSCVGPPGVVLS